MQTCLTGVIVTNWLEIGVLHGVFGSDSFGVVIPEHLAEQVECFITDELIVGLVDELGPGFARNALLGQQILIMRVKGQTVLVQVGVELLSSENFRDFDQLVVVVAALEEGFTLENHTGKHAAK